MQQQQQQQGYPLQQQQGYPLQQYPPSQFPPTQYPPTQYHPPPPQPQYASAVLPPQQFMQPVYHAAQATPAFPARSPPMVVSYKSGGDALKPRSSSKSKVFCLVVYGFMVVAVVFGLVLAIVCGITWKPREVNYP